MAPSIRIRRKDKTRIAGADKLPPGKHTIDFDFKYDGGGIGKGGSERSRSMARRPPKAASSRPPLGKFSLDESFDVGQDTGTPVIDDYDTRMPFKFTGVLNKLVIHVGPDMLTPEQHGELERVRREFALAMR